MRFLGRSVPLTTGKVYGNFKGEIISDMKHRPEGVRVKHSLQGNSIKFYDKHGLVLRVETTIVRPQEFRTFRREEGGTQKRQKAKSPGDLYGVDWLTSSVEPRFAKRPIIAICKPWLPPAEPFLFLSGFKRYVCLLPEAASATVFAYPWGPEDGRLLELISQGQFTINGFRNRDIRMAYFPAVAAKNKSNGEWAGSGVGFASCALMVSFKKSPDSPLRAH